MEKIDKKMAAVKRLQEEQGHKIEETITLELPILTIDCAMQHFATLREQSIREQKADFGEPCANCIHRLNECKQFDWNANLQPLLEHSSVVIQHNWREHRHRSDTTE